MTDTNTPTLPTDDDLQRPRLAISLRPECLDGLDDVRAMLKKQMGVQMSYSKTVEFLLVFYRKARGLEKE